VDVLLKQSPAAPPVILTVEIQPRAVNEEDFEKWYQEEHLRLLRELPGYRRCSRYVIGLKTPSMIVTQPAKYIAIHELNSLDAYSSKEAELANNTSWTVKHVEESEIAILRGWELVYSGGE
jgi:hypothetical protein